LKQLVPEKTQVETANKPLLFTLRVAPGLQSYLKERGLTAEPFNFVKSDSFQEEDW